MYNDGQCILDSQCPLWRTYPALAATSVERPTYWNTRPAALWYRPYSSILSWMDSLRNSLFSTAIPEPNIVQYNDCLGPLWLCGSRLCWEQGSEVYLTIACTCIVLMALLVYEDTAMQFNFSKNVQYPEILYRGCYRVLLFCIWCFFKVTAKTNYSIYIWAP